MSESEILRQHGSRLWMHLTQRTAHPSLTNSPAGDDRHRGKGVYLSGGEVQRIAIARAILKNANIVIMDEASAAADPENEYELQQAFQN